VGAFAIGSLREVEVLADVVLGDVVAAEVVLADVVPATDVVTGGIVELLVEVRLPVRAITAMMAATSASPRPIVSATMGDFRVLM
jgi:hypothetical protein